MSIKETGRQRSFRYRRENLHALRRLRLLLVDGFEVGLIHGYEDFYVPWLDRQGVNMAVGHNFRVSDRLRASHTSLPGLVQGHEPFPQQFAARRYSCVTNTLGFKLALQFGAEELFEVHETKTSVAEKLPSRLFHDFGACTLPGSIIIRHEGFSR
ncbi:hypothetical protein AGR3A_Cc170138 [Agrobacterium tomkonis CFBP 6623]|uniref:Uncharacterized protein n=1 Tax=Agrobacterium tomkonis CFBP 6623 TaxID=1183432 RepID=A0A1S7NVA4_9HYPH|nr:hypothetical protein AGR3A_Cc170138 [Agrobacterium tomkonis CFBP 6623]